APVLRGEGGLSGRARGGPRPFPRPATQEALMRKCCPLVLGLLFLSVPALAAEQPPGKVVEDAWGAVHLGGHRVGPGHTTTREVDVRGGKVLQVLVHTELALKRGNAVQTLKFDNGTSETADGKVLGVGMRWDQTVQKGTVEEKGLHLVVNDGQVDKYVPWND